MIRLFVVTLLLMGAVQAEGRVPQIPGDTEDQVRIFVPAFTGLDTLGKNVSNVLRLQISQTFEAGTTFGRGVLLWEDRPLKELSHNEAMRRATNIGTLAHLVLWGTAVQYGDGVVVQTYLTLTPLASLRDRRPE